MNRRINKALAIEKKLIVDNNYELYLKIENLYKRLFEKYLLSKINLKEYDNKIKKSSLYFGKPNPTQEELLNGLNEYLNLDYIFLLNNFFIEKLDNNELELLKNELDNNIDDNIKLLDMIERTYKDVIKDNYINNSYSDKSYNVCYGPVIPSNFVNNDAIIFKIFYSKNTKSYNSDEFIDNIKKKKTFLNDLSKVIINDVQNTLGINCFVLTEKISK